MCGKNQVRAAHSAIKMTTQEKMSKLQLEQFAIKGSFDFYDAEKWLRTNGFAVEISYRKHYKTEKPIFFFEAMYSTNDTRNYELDVSFGEFQNFGLAIENCEQAIFNLCLLCREILITNNIEIINE